MAVVYAADVKTDRMQAVADQIDAGSGPGILQIGTTGMVSVLCEFELGSPCGTVSGSVLTFDGAPFTSDPALATGTAAEARIRDSSDNNVVTGLTVGTSGADIVLSSTAITALDEVVLSEIKITHF